MQSWDDRTVLIIRCFHSSAFERELQLVFVLAMHCSICFSPRLSFIPQASGEDSFHREPLSPAEPERRVAAI